MKFAELMILTEAVRAHESIVDLDEGIVDEIRTTTADLVKAISFVAKNANSKNDVNDKTLRDMYIADRDELRLLMSGLHPKAQQFFTALLAKYGIKFTGVDLSRKNINRICIIKLVRFAMFIIAQQKQAVQELMLTSALSSGLGGIISVLFNTVDLATLVRTSIKSISEIRKITKAVKDTPQS